MGLYEDDGDFIDDLIAFDTANKYEKNRNYGIVFYTWLVLFLSRFI